MGKIYKYTNLVLETIQRNNRKINAIIRRSQIHRIKVYVMLISIILTIINPIYAIEEQSKVFCRIDPNMYIKYLGNPQPNYEYYYLKNNEELPVYCVNLGMKGAEEEKDGYLVNINQNINDTLLKSIVLNCYPYKSIQELGLNSREEAKFASQFAIWIYTANLNIDLIEPILTENQNVVNAIKNIYYSGINDSQRNDILKFESSEQNIEKINNKFYYTKTISTTQKELMNDIEVTTNQKDVIITKLTDSYKICVPVDIVDKQYNLELGIKLIEKAALYGISTKEGYQDVVLTLKDNLSEMTTYRVNFENMKKKVTIVKKDKDTGLPIEGVKYAIQNEHFVLIGEYETDINGEIKLELLDIRNIFVNEINVPDEYILDTETYSLELKENKENNLELYNTKKKGNIKIIKKTKEYNELTGIKDNMPLKGVSFYIYDMNMNLIDDITTDEYGCAISKKIPTGKYYIKEYKTHEGYTLLEELIEVEIINNDEMVNVEILNNNINIPKKLPVTGR